MYNGSVRHLERWRGKAVAHYSWLECIRSEHQVSLKKKKEIKHEHVVVICFECCFIKERAAFVFILLSCNDSLL